MLGERLTAIAGSSDVVRGGVIAYANDVKRSLLGVGEAVLAEHGAVSEPVVRSMANGVRSLLGVDAALAITGIAGPGGGSADKPVGTVWLALDLGGAVDAVLLRLWGDRTEIRQRSAQGALNLLRRALIGAR
jgi:nicotinamide-nucleotide amidase